MSLAPLTPSQIDALDRGDVNLFCFVFRDGKLGTRIAELQAGTGLADDSLDAAAVLRIFAADSFDNAELLKLVKDGAFAADSATRALFAAKFLTVGKAARFQSVETAATGAPQNIPHGLGAAPTAVLIVATGGHDGAGGAGDKFPTITEGAHDGTNVVVTVSNGAKFKVVAWL